MKRHATYAATAIFFAALAAPGTLAGHHEGESEMPHEHGVTAPSRIAAAAISVSDLETATAFYTEGLGMSVVRSSSGANYVENILATQDAEGTKLVLIQSLDGESSIGPSRIVFYTEDAASMIAAIKAAGFEVEREAVPLSENISTIIAIGHDADGNTLGFIQR